MKKKLKQIILDLHDKTLESGDFIICPSDSIIDLNFYNLYVNATKYDCIATFNNDNIFSVNHQYKENDGIIFIYMIGNDTNKKMTEKVINMISVMEDVYISLDMTNIKINDGENSTVYLIIYKNLSRDSVGGIE